MFKNTITRPCLTVFAITSLSLLNTTVDASAISDAHSNHVHDVSTDFIDNAWSGSHRQDHSISSTRWIGDRHFSFYGSRDDGHDSKFSDRHGFGDDDLFQSRSWSRHGSSHDRDGDTHDDSNGSYGYLWDEYKYEAYWGPDCNYDVVEDPKVVPLPGTMWFFMSGAGLLGLISRRKK